MGKVAFSDVYDLYSEAQAVTSTGNTDSTNIIDQLAPGDSFIPNFVKISIDTTFTSGGSATLAINLLTDDDVAFGSPKTFPLVAATAVASLTAGTVLYQGRLPIGMERYRKLQYVVATAAMTAGKIDAVELSEVPTNRM